MYKIFAEIINLWLKNIHSNLIERLIDWITEMFRRFFVVLDWSDFESLIINLVKYIIGLTT